MCYCMEPLSISLHYIEPLLNDYKKNNRLVFHFNCISLQSYTLGKLLR